MMIKILLIRNSNYFIGKKFIFFNKQFLSEYNENFKIKRKLKNIINFIFLN